MSTAHRPTWDPAQARDTKAGSRQFSVRDMPAHTKLKFRQVGQTSTSEVAKKDLKFELLLAEHEAKNKKRKAEGKPLLEFEYDRPQQEQQPVASIEGASEESNKRRKILQEALEADRDDDDDDEEEEEEEKEGDNANAGTSKKSQADEASKTSNQEDSDEDSDDDDEDDTDELLRELQKIKQERAAEKARQDAQTQAAMEAEVATKNPLLNLAAALGQDTPRGVNTTVPGTFSVKRRWDDDLIFKNQAMNSRDKPGQGQFVNDLLRTEFHKKFMTKFIK